MNFNSKKSLDMNWYYDNSGYYSYIMLTARDQNNLNNDVIQVIAKLQNEKIIWQARGRSSKPADNGVRYDYYIRLGVTNEISEIDVDRIKAVLRENINGAESIQQDIELDKIEIKNLRDDLINAKRKFEKISNFLDDEIRKSHKLLNDNDQLSLQVAQLESQNEQLYLSQSQESESYADMLLLIEQERNKKIEDLKLEFQMEREQLCKAKNDELNEFKQQIKELEEKYQKRFSGKLNKNEREKEFHKILEIFLPKLEIDKGSISFMLHEIEDYKFILNKLVVLNQNPKDIDSKRVQGGSGWLEITKVSDGDSNKSRIYYKKIDDTQKYDVRIRDKDTQDQDIKKL